MGSAGCVLGSTGLVWAGFALAPAAAAQVEIDKFTGSDTQGYDQFGISVAATREHLVIGAYNDADAGSGTGSAYAFRRVGDQWVEVQKLTDPQGQSMDYYGTSVAAWRDRLLVGASHSDDLAVDSGAVHAWRHDGAAWVPDGVLKHADPGPYDQFGSAVALLDDVAVVGAFRKDVYHGAAYVFVRGAGGWVQAQKLQPIGDPDDLLDFGGSVALLDDWLFVGATGDRLHPSAPATGAVYVFHRTGDSWLLVQKLVPDDGQHSDNFGGALAVDGDVLVVGAAYADGASGTGGAAYAFRWNGSIWLQEQKLFADDGTATNAFGSALSLAGGTLLVGDYSDDDQGENSGSAYVFRRHGSAWVQQAKLLGSNGAEQENFGWAVVLTGTEAVITSELDDEAGTYSGSAFVFDLASAPPF